MLKLLKYMKPFTISIIAIIALLFGQAMTDLALPDYMSRIVNNGIQQGGIENAAPGAMRASTYEILTKLMSDQDKAEVNKYYTYLEKGKLSDSKYKDYVKSYPQLAKEPIYVMKEVKKAKLEELNQIFGKPILIVAGMQQKMLKDQYPDGKIPEDLDPFAGIDQVPAEQLDQAKQMAGAQIDQLSETMINQTAVTMVKKEYNQLQVDTNKVQNNYLFKVGGFMLLVTVLGGICMVAVSYLSAKVGAGFSRDLRGRIFRKVESFSTIEFDKFSTASLITRTTNDVQQVQMVVIMFLRMVFYAPMLAIGGIYKVVSNDSSMSWVTALAVGALFALIAVIFFTAIPKFKIVQKLVDKLNLVSRESLTGMMVIRAFNTQKHEEGRFDQTNIELTKTNLFINRVTQILWPIMTLILNGSSLLIIWVGSHHVDQGTLQVGNMMAFMQYTTQIIFSFLMVSMVFILIPRAAVSGKRISEVLEEASSIIDPVHAVPFSAQKGVVEFKDVSFKFPGAEEYALKNINFTTKPGETTAFIGSTGSGKSTLVNLIPRFYDVTEGEILVDGIDIRKVKQHDLREKIGYVPQKGVLFSGTIADNLSFGRERVDTSTIQTAVRVAQAENFIHEKTDGMETEISQGGSNVSGGQKQRLSIARALTKKAEIYIFDDSFSALDFKTDATLRKALKSETTQATVLIVAQRISSIMHAEQIIVLNDGKIVGMGTHQQLMKDCQVYQDIANSQLSKEELGYE